MTAAPDATFDPRPLTRVGIVAKRHLYEAAQVLDEIAAWLRARGIDPLFETATAALAASGEAYPHVSRDDLAAQVDLVLVLGGDGSLLGMADRIALAPRNVPMLGVNYGSLGFLTEVTLPELFPSLESVLAGTAAYEERCMLVAAVTHADESAPFTRIVLNDVVVTKGVMSRIIDLSAWVDEEFVASFKADGLIIATPTGSTAYNLSAGGPIVHPHTPALVLTPIAPHTLTNRPLVLPSSSTIVIRPLADDDVREIYVTFDGQSGCPLGTADTLTVTRAPRPLRLVRAATRGYFGVLRRKLKWAER
jgi:NAD+ kinase